MFCLLPQRPTALYQTAQTKVLLDDDVCSMLDVGLKRVMGDNIPFTAAMTNRICIVSVAQVK